MLNDLTVRHTRVWKTDIAGSLILLKHGIHGFAYSLQIENHIWYQYFSLPVYRLFHLLFLFPAHYFLAKKFSSPKHLSWLNNTPQEVYKLNTSLEFIVIQSADSSETSYGLAYETHFFPKTQILHSSQHITTWCLIKTNFRINHPYNPNKLNTEKILNGLILTLNKTKCKRVFGR